MNTNSWPRVALACSLMLTLIGCSSAAQRAQIEAGERAGQATAQVTIERQPPECALEWGRLPYAAGDQAVTVIRRYEAFIEGPINDRARRCYWFNENQRRGLAGVVP